MDQEPRITPEPIMAALSAHQLTAALKAAVELDVFTAIGEGCDQTSTLAPRVKADARGVRILSDFLCVHGLLGKQDGRYRLTPASAKFLDRRSPAYMGGVTEFLCSDRLMEAFRDVGSAVRRGGTVMPNHGTMGHDDPIWLNFARSMVPVAKPMAEVIAKILAVAGMGPMKVLDIAAGHGMYGITVAQHNPQAEVWALDWRSVLAIAEEHAWAAGVRERYHLIPGSAFSEDLGAGYDLVLVTNFFHHFDLPTCEGLARRIRQSLNPGGKMVTAEFVPDEDRVSPPGAALFAMTMLNSTEKGDAYTLSEYDQLFRAAGFGETQMHDAGMQRILVTPA